MPRVIGMQLPQLISDYETYLRVRPQCVGSVSFMRHVKWKAKEIVSRLTGVSGTVTPSEWCTAYTTNASIGVCVCVRVSR